MKTIKIAIVIFVAVAAAGPALRAQNETVNSVWAPQALKIDGSGKDWEGTAFSQWNKGAVQYAFRNDGSSLYLLFTIMDPKMRSTIEELGLTVYIAPEGQENKDYGILFRRKRITANEFIGLLEKAGPVSEDQKEKMRATAFYNYYYAEVVDKNGEAVAVPQGVGGPPALFKYATEKKTLVHELKIPLVRVHPAWPGLGAGPGAAVSIGLEWGGPTEEQRKALARARGAQSDISNETGLGRSTDITAGARKIEQMPAKHIFWNAVKLAESK